MGRQLELDVTAFLGMTDWFDLDRVQPEAAGWYEVRFKMPEGERQVRNPRPQRRWWQPHQDYGDGHVVYGCFSRPVNVGEEYQEEDIRSLQLTPAVWGYGAMEWRGLAGPHPDMPERKKIRV